VVQFGELHMWGRGATGVALDDDEEFVAAVGPSATPAAPKRKAAKRKRAKPAKRPRRR
jgi:hypothetical protein